MTGDEFQMVGKTKTKHGRIRAFDELYAEARSVVRGSDLLQSLSNSLQKFELTHLRCLALGSFHEDAAARFQLALLAELVELKKIKRCSLFDPVFTEEDTQFVEQHEGWTVDDKSPFLDVPSERVLFFLPHAPLNLTENVISQESPKVWLANDLIQHTDRYTRAQLYAKYPMVSKLVNFMDPQCQAVKEDAVKSKSQDQDGFQTFTSKKRKSQNRKKVFKTVPIDFDSIDSYFEGCNVLDDFKKGALLTDKAWLNAFSDLSLHIIE